MRGQTDRQIQTDRYRQTATDTQVTGEINERHAKRETDRDTERARRKYREQTELQRYLIVQIDKRHNIHLDLIMHIALQTKSLTVT